MPHYYSLDLSIVSTVFVNTGLDWLICCFGVKSVLLFAFMVLVKHQWGEKIIFLGHHSIIWTPGRVLCICVWICKSGLRLALLTEVKHFCCYLYKKKLSMIICWGLCTMFKLVLQAIYALKCVLGCVNSSC